MRRLAFALLAAALVTVTPAVADMVTGTRFDVVERADAIDVRLARGFATLVMTRTVENPGPKSDQVVFDLEIPEGAVATRLRMAGVDARGEPVWFEGDLLEAEEAARRYRELTGIGGYYPKDPALLSWRSQTGLALQVFPVPARSTKTVEVTLRMPLAYEDGAFVLRLPKLGTDAMPARVRVRPERSGDTVTVNGVEISEKATIVAKRELEIALAPAGTAMIGGALASVEASTDKHLVHARIEAAPRLSRVPANASVVVLLDTSRSMERRLPSTLGALRAYLARFPGASVELLTFDRATRSPFGGPLPARELLSRLYGYTPPTGNGSNVELAVAAADAKLASRRGPRRVLLLTDLLTRHALTPERLAARTMTSGAIVHVATVGDGEPSLERDDESAWATLPRRTGGLLWSATCPATLGADDRAVFEEWVRPTRIEKLKVSGMPPDVGFDSTLREGEGLEHLGVAGAAVTQVALEGELWSSPVRWSMAPSADEGRRWAGFVFGTSLYSELDESQQMTLAMHGRVVSPVTSYLAIEPGVRPSTEGLDWGAGAGGGGWGAGIGLGGIGTMSHGCGGGGGSDGRKAFLEGELARALATCGAPSGASARVALESTLDEIVDVGAVTLAPAPDAKVEECAREKVWAVRLGIEFVDDHADWEVSATAGDPGHGPDASTPSAGP